MANVLVILMPQYRDEEFTIPYALIKKAGHSVAIAGLIDGPAIGAGGHSQPTTMMLSQLSPKDLERYNILVIPGGPGSKKHLWTNKLVKDTIKYFYENKKGIAAICYAVIALVHAGILHDKKATVYPTEEAKAIFSEFGVKFSEEPCITLPQEKIITAQGPKAAEAFGNAIITSLA